MSLKLVCTRARFRPARSYSRAPLA